MSGYGIRSTTRQCTLSQARERSDTQQAYAALVAKALDADYQINAISGRGMVRNYVGSLPGQAMRDVYGRTFFREMGHPYSDRSWRPQIVVIKLNADFVTPLNPGEPWRDIPALMADYVDAMGDLIDDLHRRSPSANMLLWWFDTNEAADPAEQWMFAEARRTIARRAAAAGVGHFEFISPSGFGVDMSACDSHGSLADHQKIARWMLDYLKVHPDFWAAR
jgi:hypothetical protein